MTFKVTTIKTRPALNIAWIAGDDAGATLQGAADTAGKLLTNSNSLSDDGLSITTTQTWVSKQVYIDYVSLEEVATLRLARTLHQITNMISAAVTYENVE